MKLSHWLLIVVAVVFIGACQSAERRESRAKANAADSEAKVHEERLKLIDEYKKCLEEAGDEGKKVEECDRYLRAAEALK